MMVHGIDGQRDVAYWRDQGERMGVRAARLAAEADRLATEAADADRRELRLVGGGCDPHGRKES